MENKLDDLMRKFYTAKDSASILEACNAMSDWREGDGILDPGYALCVSLLLKPDYIPQAREILPDARKLESSGDRRLYQAILETPYTGDLSEWWQEIERVAGVGSVGVALSCEYANAHKFALYARLAVVRWSKCESLSIADDVARSADDSEKISQAIERLYALRAALERAQSAGNQTTATAPKWGGAWKAR